MLKDRLSNIIRELVTIVGTFALSLGSSRSRSDNLIRVGYANRKTIQVPDVIYVLKKVRSNLFQTKIVLATFQS